MRHLFERTSTAKTHPGLLVMDTVHWSSSDLFNSYSFMDYDGPNKLTSENLYVCL